MFSDKKLFFLFISHIFSLCIFLKGFFPIENVTSQDSLSFKNINRDHKHTSKLVFLIIDAIRYDFVDPAQKNHGMPFVQNSIINNNSCFLRIEAHAPTVTLPRIKALTSGTIPNFLDIVLNLGSSEFVQDTFLHQAVNAGLKIVFYGDNTWLKMFPKLFVRSGGTHSFFATDYWEVDNNVTQSVRQELKRDDWDIMIIHYLGLDHIGHIEGPRSKLVPTKLKEMDDIIKEISNVLKQNYTDTKFVITGDHGMKDSGGHGGVSSAEINVPLVMVGDPCRYLSGWPDSRKIGSDQIDIAATISIALGLPIPSASIGKFIPELLNGFSDTEILRNLETVKQNLFKRIDSSSSAHELTYDEIHLLTRNNTLLKEAVAKYYLELNIISEQLLRNRLDYNIPIMMVGCFLQWSCLAAYVFSYPFPKPKHSIHFLLLFGSILYSFSLGSSSFIEEEHQTWYFLWTTFLVLSLRRNLTSNLKSTITSSGHLILICILHRYLRRLNQTGDKWASLPDWDDYLHDSPALLLSLFFTSILWLFISFLTTNTKLISRILFCSCLLSIAAYRTSVGTFTFLHIYETYPQSRGHIEVQVFYFLFTIFFISSHLWNIKFYWAWSLLITLALRPHNIILVPVFLYVSRQIYRTFPRTEDNFWNTLVHIWTGYIFYFYQGNSNSLATIDVAPAFIGCTDYYPIYGALMTAIHTYAAPGLALLMSPHNLNAVLLLRFLPVTIYTSIIISQRHHLFIWSVFSPKLLLESTLSIYICVLLCFNVVNSLVQKRLD